MSAHVNSFKELSTQVANLSPNGIGIPDIDLVSMLSLSLPELYDPLIMAVQSKADNITFDFLTGRLLPEATRRQAARYKSTAWNSEPLSAFAAGSNFHSGSYRGRGNSRGEIKVLFKAWEEVLQWGAEGEEIFGMGRLVDTVTTATRKVIGRTSASNERGAYTRVLPKDI